MRKNNWLVPKFMISLVFIAINFSCEKDFNEDVTQKNKASGIREVHFEKLLKEKKFKNLLTKVNEHSSSKSTSARSAFEDKNGFTISDSKVKIIETDSLTSYTILIERDENTDNTFFENLVIQEDIFNNQRAVIFKYVPTQMTAAVHDSFHFKGKIYKSVFTNFTSLARGATQTTFSENCYESVLVCNQGGSEHAAGANCTQIYVTRIKVICAGDSGSGGGDNYGNDDDFWSGGGDPNDYWFGDPFAAGGGGPSGETYTPIEDFPNSDDVVTSPIRTPHLNAPTKTPCQQLALMTMNFALKNALTDLKTKTGETREFGYKVTKTNRTFNNPTPNNADPNNPNQILMSAGGNNVGCFHTHPDPATTGTYPMFSAADIKYLLDVTTYHNNNGQPKDFSEYFITLTVDGGTFALKIKDFLNFRSQMAMSFEGDDGIKETLENNHFDFREPCWGY